MPFRKFPNDPPKVFFYYLLLQRVIGRRSRKSNIKLLKTKVKSLKTTYEGTPSSPSHVFSRILDFVQNYSTPLHNNTPGHFLKYFLVDVL